MARHEKATIGYLSPCYLLDPLNQPTIALGSNLEHTQPRDTKLGEAS